MPSFFKIPPSMTSKSDHSVSSHCHYFFSPYAPPLARVRHFPLTIFLLRPILPILFWKEVMKPYFYDLYRAVSRVFNPSLLFVFRVKRILIPIFFLFLFRSLVAFIHLGSRIKKITRSSCKITSMIYTSNCILSKVVSEASVGHFQVPSIGRRCLR